MHPILPEGITHGSSLLEDFEIGNHRKGPRRRVVRKVPSVTLKYLGNANALGQIR